MCPRLPPLSGSPMPIPTVDRVTLGDFLKVAPSVVFINGVFYRMDIAYACIMPNKDSTIPWQIMFLGPIYFHVHDKWSVHTIVLANDKVTRPAYMDVG